MVHDFVKKFRSDIGRETKMERESEKLRQEASMSETERKETIFSSHIPKIKS